MRRVLGMVALASLLVLAGCSGPFADWTTAPTDPSGATDDPAATDAPRSDPTAGTDAPARTETSFGNLSADNPFGQAVVPVAVNDSVNDGRNTTALVATAIDYWNARIDRHTPFNYRFVLANESQEARVEVRFVEEIQSCGRDHDVRTVGCAPLLEAGDTAPDVADARVEMHGSNSAVVGTIEHELGHILSLRHDDEPLVVMGQMANTSVPDHDERAVPWYTNDLLVYVDHESFDGDRAEIEAQVGHALEYYNDGAEGTIPTNVTFTRTDHEASADIVVSNDPQYRCGGRSGGAGWVRQGVGHIDTDPAMEMYVRSFICIDGDDEDAFGWYVGYFLGQSMGLEEGELAPPLQDDSYFHQRSEWWE